MFRTRSFSTRATNRQGQPTKAIGRQTNWVNPADYERPGRVDPRALSHTNRPPLKGRDDTLRRTLRDRRASAGDPLPAVVLLVRDVEHLTVVCRRRRRSLDSARGHTARVAWSPCL